MDQSDVKSIVNGLRDSINEIVKTTVYEHHVLKDKEISSLHREINNNMKGMSDKMEYMSINIQDVKTKVDSHDTVIKELMEVYKTAGTVKKMFISVIVGIPSLAAFFAGLIYLAKLFER